MPVRRLPTWGGRLEGQAMPTMASAVSEDPHTGVLESKMIPDPFRLFDGRAQIRGPLAGISCGNV